MTKPITILGQGMSLADWGLIPSFLDPEDERSAKEQFAAKYIGGWQPFEGFKLNKDSMQLKYPDDPPLSPIGYMFYGDEVIVLYPFSWVLVMDATKQDNWEVCRMD